MSDRKVSLDHVSEDYEDKDSLSDASFDDNNEHVVVNDVSKASTINDDSPFKHEWSYGFNPKVALTNVTKESSNRTFVTSSDHILQVFHHDGNRMECFVGHESDIFALATESTGRFVVSADIAGVVNIWDLTVTSDFPYPIRSIYEGYNEEKISKIALSCDGKFLLTATEGRGSLVKLWKWSSATSKEEDKPKYSFEIPDNFNRVESIQFSENSETLQTFVITLSNGTLFAEWDDESQKINRHIPIRAISIKFHYVESTFIGLSTKAMTISKCGSVVVWNCGSEDRHSYKKELLKTVKLTNEPLTSIRAVDKFVVIADVAGHIRFYDEELKIVFWCPTFDKIDSIKTIAFNLEPKNLAECENVEIRNQIRVRNFLVRELGKIVGVFRNAAKTKNEIYSIDVSQMKFERVFYKSDDFITAIDLHPTKRNMICGANYSGRIFLYKISRRRNQVVENQLKLHKRKSSTSDTDIIEIPHISCLSYSHEGHDLMCGTDSGILILLDPDILTELSSINLSNASLVDIKFSPESSFVVVYDELSMVAVLHRDDAERCGWALIGKLAFHTKPICDVLYITQPNPIHKSTPKLLPRLISLATDRHVVEYDLLESVRGTLGLVTSFTKRIFQSVFPVSMTLIFNRRLGEHQILIADNEMKFRIFDRNTFEILATFLGPIYDTHVRQLHSSLDLDRFSSKFLVFSTNKNICLYALPLDGNPFRSLGVVGHTKGVRKFRVDERKRRVFTIGYKSYSIASWRINFCALQQHLDEGGKGLAPYCDLLPGGKIGSFLNRMQDLYFYMLLMSNNNFIDDRVIREGLDVHEAADFMRGLGFFPSDYEIECMQHEMSVRGKRKIPFEELVKIFINHSRPCGSRASLDKAFRQAMKSDEQNSTSIIVKKCNLISILAESAERIDVKDADLHLKEIFRDVNGKLVDEMALDDLLVTMSQ